ncbi:MAG: 3D-(3,5/4)-trihydroxycyclohexane-1,2-dione acylhydrolase (decyclizing) [Acidobacteriota bacterium]
MQTRRMTMAQALVAFLKNQYVERDGQEIPFFAGVWGIFGHGNVAGVGQALQQDRELPYFLARNEQAMVHTASGFAKASRRLRTFACASSIGPGATNMITGAAAATINRLPVLLLPGDLFARRNVAPVLQQLESEHSQDLSVNDCFKPVSRYWDRLNRPDQLPYALLEAMRVLTSPAETGAVTLCLPQDVQTEAWDYPDPLFQRRTWSIPRPLADRNLLRTARQWITSARKPVLIAGGGVIYSDATEALRALVEKTGIGVVETQAGKGSLRHDHPNQLGALGVTGTPAANAMARQADLVLAVGTRLSDFTTASKTAFQNPDVRFVNLNICSLDACKQSALPLLGDARATLRELAETEYAVSSIYRETVAKLKREWEVERERLFNLHCGLPISQAEAIGVINDFVGPRDVVVCAAGSLPGDLHKLWNASSPLTYHLEYGYSCMGYEIAGGLGVKMADPSREVYVLVGDGSYLMMSSEIVTSLQEDHKLNIVLFDNHGFGSIGNLSKGLGSQGFGTSYRKRDPATGQLDGEVLPVDFVSNAASLGAHSIQAFDTDSLKQALEEARARPETTVISIEVDKEQSVPGYGSWWDVAVAEVSEMESVKRARQVYREARRKERPLL